MSRKQLIEELPHWLAHNFPHATPSQQLLGMIEELGELTDTVLKFVDMTHQEYFLMALFSEVGKLAHICLKRIQGVRQQDTDDQRELHTVARLKKAIREYRNNMNTEPIFITPGYFILEQHRQPLREILTERDDAIGDLDIFMQSFCVRSNIDREAVLAKTWNEVRTRDWVQFPKNGKME